MIDFITWTAFILVSFCLGVFTLLFVVIILNIVSWWKFRVSLKTPLPPPDKASERMYGQQYFDRAMKK